MNQIYRPQRPRIGLSDKEPRSLYGWILGMLVLGLAGLPFISALNDLMTKWVVKLQGYKIISEFIVPQEVSWTVVILRVLGIDAQTNNAYVFINQPGRGMLIEIIWNCIGWQSLLMFMITAIMALQMGYSALSKAKALVIGVIGTILINILRIVTAILIFIYLGQQVGMVFHDYGALLTNTLWLVFFWWFSYKYVLEEQVPADTLN